MRYCLLCILAASLALAVDRKEIDVIADQVWTDTGIDLKAGDTLTITATGTVQYDGVRAAGPEGLARAWMDLMMQLPVNGSGRGALVGRFGDSPASRPFLIGPRTQRTVPIPSRLFVGINQMPNAPGKGSYHVTIERTAVAPSKVSAGPTPLPAFTQAMLDQIPPRVNDAMNNQGDRVNFILIGSQEKVQSALSTAGWMTVDKTKRDAIVRGLLTSLSKEAYVTLPMSELELFGRVQDFGYAQADPVTVVASRHHFRIWKAPFTAGGETVWAGAGTHDIGFEKDQRNNGITHKIDPATDGERDYIGQSLQQTGMVVKEEYLMPTHPVKEARTATGGGFTSDGRMLVIYLQPEARNYAVDFASTFCSVLAQSNPDGGSWGTCDQYLEGANAKSTAPLPPLSPDYHVVIAPGFLSSCFADTPAFQKGVQALHDKYGFAVDTIPVPNDASSANARLIAQFIQTQVSKDSRKLILVGYSKGAPDIYESLATNPGLASRVAAFVSVAGAIGGSPMADALPQQAEKWIKQFNLSGCQGDMNSGFKSLGRATRQAFLASYPQASVPTYSVVAQSSRENTSKSLLESWQVLQSYGTAEDGQLLKQDAVLPGSKLLGAALADHFAVALPFETSNQKYLQSGMDKNHFPRAALLEAIMRFVEADLKTQSASR
jgi:hypothetical protein